MSKATAFELELNNLVKSDNALALSKIFDAYGGAITSKLKKLYFKYAKIDETLVLQSVNDALWGYYRNPYTFDPDKNTLLRFLEIAAERDLINLLKKERKFLDFKNDLPSDVELEEKMWNRATVNGDSPESDFINKEVLRKIDKQFKNHFKNERDIELAKLILGKVRETSRFSTVLEISELDIDEQQKLVKQHKDRIKKILDRHNLEVTLKKSNDMNDTLKLLEYAAKKVVSENAFMGFLFSRFMETEHVNENDLITLLNCSLEDYYKLCLCKAPDTTAVNYIEKVRELSEYSNVEVFELNKIIKRANVIISLSQSPNSLLMAARDKNRKSR